MIRMTYAIFLPNSQWARASNKRQALSFARKHSGYVTAMSLAGAGNGAWDAPTFRVCSDIIADFRTSSPIVVCLDNGDTRTGEYGPSREECRQIQERTP